MSSAFGDFGPLTERRRAEKARQQQKRLMIAGGTVCIVVILVAVAVMYSGKQGGASSSEKGGKGKSGGGGGGGSGESSPVDLKAVSRVIKVVCTRTDFQDACVESLGKAAANASGSAPVDVVRTAVQVIGDAISKGFDRADMIMTTDPLVKAAVTDCKEFFDYAKDELARTLKDMDAAGAGAGGKDGLSKQSYQLRVWLSAVIAHQETCIDGFPDGEFKDKVKESFVMAKELTSNALALIEQSASLLSSAAATKVPAKRRLLGKDGIPEWVPDGDRRVLKGGGFKNKLTPDVIVAKDGTGKFKTINEALVAMPKTYKGRYTIYVKEGVYDEYVTITKTMVNVTLYGDGGRKSIVTGKKSFADGITTFKTATFTAQGDGFMAIGMGFENTAGAAKHQAVALLVLSDKSIFLNCQMNGFQDTLYAHSKAQFYRNCVVTGTVDFIFGDAAAVFQNCVITLRRPMDSQQNIATAQGRADGREATGFVLHKCEFNADPDLTAPGRPPIRSYLGRPWRECSRTVIMESVLPAIIDKAGYMPWNGEFALKTLFYAEYGNTGPGADTAGRVPWPGYKKTISKADATQFTLNNFLHAQPWIDPTGTPAKYDFFA